MAVANNASKATSTLFWGHGSAFWDTGLIWAVVAAFVAGGAIAIFTFGSVSAHRLEAREAGTQLAAANDKATSASDALQNLRKDAAPRTLAEHQRATIAEAIAGKVTIALQVQSDPGDTEAYSYAIELADALKRNGKPPEWHPWPTTFMWFNEPGVFVVPFGRVPASQSDALVHALVAAGIDAKAADLPKGMTGDPAKPPPPTLSVVVWKKVPPSPST